MSSPGTDVEDPDDRTARDKEKAAKRLAKDSGSDLVSDAKSKKQPRKRKQNRTIKKDVRDTIEFIRLCEKHIMGRNLDSVQRTVWMTKDKCDIFLIGEIHRRHTRCKSIYDMFDELLAENHKLKPPVRFDMLLEQYVGYLGFNYKKYKPYEDHEEKQIFVVRDRLYDCLHKRGCDVRVHWTDSTRYDGEHLPKWLFDLANDYDEFFKDDWVKNDLIHSNLQNEGDLPKLLTLNKPVMKEIERASRVNPAFTLDFALSMFERINNREMQTFPSHNWRKQVSSFIRNVVDIYTVARLIKSEMKHVVIYAGDSHVRNCIEILTALGFQTAKESVGSCP
jgi:hypothetical protein